jgi:LPS O-antigen subunit length determinant protein (WzzB/FepE family)
MMNLELTAEQAEAVEVLLRQYLPELSHEIAGTDNAEYRSKLTRRRKGLVEVQEALVRLLASPAFPPKSSAKGLERELAHPGD